MFKQFINTIPGADLYMVSSFLIFFVFFLLVGLYLLIVNKKHIRYMAELPLEEEPNVQALNSDKQ